MVINITKKFEYSYVKDYFESQGYKLLSKEYKNAMEKLEVCCPEGHISNMTFMNFKVGHRCKRCGAIKFNERNKHSYEYVKDYIESFGYELISEEYENINAKLFIKCPNGHIFDTTFKKFKQGNRCRFCNETNGENKIKTILIKENIKYISQYKFKDCRFKRVLPFDFYLPDYNCCIEYDGEQHYIIKKYFGGYERFIDTKIRDTIKNIYCENNNIKLIRIPYWEFKNIDKILKKELRQVNTEVNQEIKAS